jgi:hypothetical protein
MCIVRVRNCFPSRELEYTPAGFSEICCTSYLYVLCFVVFVLCLVCPMLPVSLDSQFLIVPSTISLFIYNKRSQYIQIRCATYLTKTCGGVLKFSRREAVSDSYNTHAMLLLMYFLGGWLGGYVFPWRVAGRLCISLVDG